MRRQRGFIGSAALIGAGVGLVGDVMAQQGQQSTNAQQMAIAQKEMDWQTQMSDTAMQRRVADLKAAGLNPMLAAGGPGAVVGSPVMPQMQNPMATFSNAGNQVTSAMQLNAQDAQIAQLKASAAQASAQAGKTQAETDQVIPAQVENIKSSTGLNDVRATEVTKNVQLLDYGLKSGLSQIGMQEDVAQKAIRTHIMQMDQQTQSDTMLTLIKARNDANFATSIGAQNISRASDTEFGRIMSYFHLAAPLTSAVGVAGRLIP